MGRYSFANPILIAAGLALLPGSCLTGWAGLYTVTNTADSGAGSLRQAIIDANLDLGSSVISFQLSGSAPFTITPTTLLPSLTRSILIDGTTQPGYASAPLIELNGASAGAGAIGLNLASPFCGVKGLVINRFPTQGVLLSGVSNTVQGCYIGTDPTGKIARGNTSFGVWVSSSGNLIGGTNAGEGNLIAANDTGIYLSTASGNTVQGNLIGVDITGTNKLGNVNNGITLDNGSKGNWVGGTTTAARNFISGNGQSGLFLNGAGVSNNVIQGNYIGLNKTGSAALTNGGDGITLNGAPRNTIGGAASGMGNVISGNALAGVAVDNAGATGNVLLGNFIGTDATGKLGIGNRNAGIVIAGAGANQIGGTDAGAGNVVSGNVQDGIYLTNASANVIQGNLIGVSVFGTNALPNGFNGISLRLTSSNTIGGTLAGARNIISGNGVNGVGILHSNDTANVVLGNYIGTDLTGSKAIANAASGIRIQASSNVVGGVTAGSGNLISGNGQYGLYLVGTNGRAAGNLVAGNLIGLNAAGTAALPNAVAGVVLSSAAKNQIGGSSAAARNVISGNGSLPNVGYVGIYLNGPLTISNVIQGNYLGTDPSGMLARPNANEGIYIVNAVSNVIGGSTAGAGNLISGNNARGVWLVGAGGNVLQGNWIGVKADGTGALGNVWHGIDLDTGSTNNLIGGAAAGEGNRLAFAQSIYTGVRVRSGAYNNRISGNSVFSNGALGIDLGNAGVNANLHLQNGALATDANRLQNYPVLSNAVTGTGTLIRGSFDSIPNKTYKLEFFASPVGDSSGYGEGQLFLGQTNFALGNISPTNFAVAVPVAAPSGWVITATATDATNNTSEFSNWVGVWTAPTLRIAGSGSGIQMSWTNAGGSYTLLSCTNLAAPLWIPAGVNAPTNGTYIVPVTPTNPAVFYRLQAL